MATLGLGHTEARWQGLNAIFCCFPHTLAGSWTGGSVAGTKHKLEPVYKMYVSQRAA